MGLRAIIRDILGIYVGYEVVRIFFFGGALSNIALMAAIILLLFGVWFLLERVGILPKMT